MLKKLIPRDICASHSLSPKWYLDKPCSFAKLDFLSVLSINHLLRRTRTSITSLNNLAPIPNLMTMMPSMGRGVTPMQPRMQMPPQNMQMPPQNMQYKMPMGGIGGMGTMLPGMIRTPMMNPIMVRPPQGGIIGKYFI